MTVNWSLNLSHRTSQSSWATAAHRVGEEHSQIGAGRVSTSSGLGRDVADGWACGATPPHDLLRPAVAGARRLLLRILRVGRVMLRRQVLVGCLLDQRCLQRRTGQNNVLLRRPEASHGCTSLKEYGRNRNWQWKVPQCWRSARDANRGLGGSPMRRGAFLDPWNSAG